MKVSILPGLFFNSMLRAGKPLQSRADQNTRKTESGSQPEKDQLTPWAERRVKVASLAGSAQTHQIIWHQIGPECPTAIRQRSGLEHYSGPLPRGETQ
ncbi:MAG: hypothetical protein I8H71_04655 [Xanthomonadaceae bacterium]|nr:hypothetical protein [Xanthomonadaceae bacterium]